MDSTQITIQAFVDSNMYVSFALFDMLRIQKRWIRPAIFAAFFSCLSLLAFWRTSEVEGAALLGSVLLTVGIGLPAVYFGSFFLSVHRQKSGYTGKEAVYSIRLNENGFAVTKGKQSAEWKWDKVISVHRMKRCICIYTGKHQAFLIPLTNKNGTDSSVWALITSHVDSARIK